MIKKAGNKKGGKPPGKTRRVAPHQHHYVVVSQKTMGDGTVWTYSQCSCGDVKSRAA
jgi:hypothetical protein